MLDHLIDGKKSLPGSFRRMCHHLKTECNRKMMEEGIPEDSMQDPGLSLSFGADYSGLISFLFFACSAQCSLRLVGSFIFLRYFCPALTTPQLFGATDRTSFTPEERRGLILIAKVFIGLGADSDLAAKEDYMIPLNNRLVSQKERMREYLSFVSSVRTTPSDLPFSFPFFSLFSLPPI